MQVKYKVCFVHCFAVGGFIMQFSMQNGGAVAAVDKHCFLGLLCLDPSVKMDLLASSAAAGSHPSGRAVH